MPVFVKKLATKFDNEDAKKPRITHYKGGEAFTSGLEEYLVRNYNEKKTMEEIINQFDRMRPTVRLEVRSQKNTNLPPDQAVFTNAPKAMADFLTDPNFNPEGTSQLELGYGGQRIFNSFTIGGIPTIKETVDRDQRTGEESYSYTRQNTPADPKDYQFDKISIIAKNPDQDRFTAGDLTKSPVIKTFQQKKDGSHTIEKRLDEAAARDRRGAAVELRLPGIHDYYNKGFGYTRAMIVEGTDGKLYAVLEENQSDITRTYENLLDFSKPEYDLALKFGGVPELLSGSIDLALKGNDPYLTRKAALLGGTGFTDRRRVKDLRRTRDNLRAHKLLTPSEKNKIDVLDDMDQNMPDNDAPSQFDVDLRDKKKKFDEAVKQLNMLDDQINKNQIFIDTFRLTERAPQELEKFTEIGLEDLLKFKKEVIPRMKKYFNQRRKTNLTLTKPLSDAERNNIVTDYLERFGNTADVRLQAENEIKRIEDERGKTAKRISFRQLIDENNEQEQLNGLDEIIERTLFSESDYEDFFQKAKERIDNLEEEGEMGDLDGFIVTSEGAFEFVSKGRPRFLQTEPDMFRRAPEVAKDTYGREVIRLFNEMAGYIDGYTQDTRSNPDASKARFRDKYERYADSYPDHAGSSRGFAYDGLVMPNKFMKASTNQDRSFDLGHRIYVPNNFEEIGRGKFSKFRNDKNIEQYEEGKDVFSILMKHMPFASTESGENREKYPQEFNPRRVGVNENREQLRRGADGKDKIAADRRYSKNSVTYDLGRSEEDQKLTRTYATSYNGDPKERLRDDISQLMQENSVKEGKYYDYFENSEIFASHGFRRDRAGDGFYGRASRDGDQELVRDAVEKALNLSVSDAMHEAINEKALDLIKHRVASEIVRKHKDVIDKIDFTGIMESSINDNYRDNNDDLRYITDNLGFVNGHSSQVNYEDVTQKIKDALPNNVMKDVEKILSKAIDEVTDKVGFVPEDGNYKEYMKLIDEEKETAVGKQTVEKYKKKLGLDNPDKLKKKILMGSILNRERTNPTAIRLGARNQSPNELSRRTIERSMNPLQRFMRAGDQLGKNLFAMETFLKPVGYTNEEHGAGSGYYLTPDPTMGNFFQLLTTQAYRGYMEGDKERADRLAEQADKLVYRRGELKKQRDDNEVGATDDAEIDRRFDKMREYIDQNAENYNYSPEELKAALQRVRDHVVGNEQYYRAPHNANEAQTARGLLHSLIHQVTDPRFEQLYGRPIEGVVLPHRKDLYFPRAIEDSGIRAKGPNAFSQGTYGSVMQALIERFEAAGANVDRDRIFEMKNVKDPNGPTASLNLPVQGVIDLSKGSLGRKIAEGKFTFRAKGGYIDLRRKAS